MTASKTVKKRRLNNGRTEEQTSNEKNGDGKEEEHDGRDNGGVGDNGSQITGQTEAVSKSTNVSHTIHKSIDKDDSDCSGNKKEFVKQKYNTILSNRLPLMKELITNASISTALLSSYAVMLYEMSTVQNMAISNIVQLIHVFFCAKLDYKGKKFFTTPNGRLISSFRGRCLKNCILHLARGYNSGASDTPSISENRSGLPAWVKRIVPKTTIIERIKKIEEEVGPCLELARRRKDIIKGCKVSTDDESFFVMHHIYSTVVNALLKNRKQVRRLFTKHVGFLLINWKDIGFTKLEQKTEIIWLRPLKESKLSLPSSIVENKTVISDGDIEVENEKLLSIFITRHEEMIAYIVHPILCWPKKYSRVRKGADDGGTAVENAPKQKLIRKKISLIELAVMMLRDMTGFEEQKTLSEALKFNRKTLAASYALAVCLKTIINENKSETVIRDKLASEVEINCRQSANEEMNDKNDDNNWIIKTEEDSSKIIYPVLENVLCGAGETYRLLEGELLRQTDDWYNKNHVPFTNEADLAMNGNDYTGLPTDGECLEEPNNQEDFEADL